METEKGVVKMKRMFVIIPALVFLLGISDVAFAKQRHHHQKEDNKDRD